MNSDIRLGNFMASRFATAVLATAFLALAAPTDAAAAANGVTPADIKATTGLISYLYEGYANGAAERKSFFDTVPWDIETGRLVERVDRCSRVEGELDYFDFDWPSASQDPQILNLKVTYVGSTKPGLVTVRAAFVAYKTPITIDYDMMLYDSAPLPRRWGVSNIRIHSKDLPNTPDLLTALKSDLAGECKAYNKD
jgi:hypothetical protein